MANESMKLLVKTGENNAKNYWDNCGVLFIDRNAVGEITSIHPSIARPA